MGGGKGGGASPPAITNSGGGNEEMMGMMMQMMAGMAAAEPPPMPQTPAPPPIAETPKIDWGERQAELAAKMKADYSSGAAKKKGRLDTIHTSPLLEEEEEPGTTITPLAEPTEPWGGFAKSSGGSR